MGTTDLSSERGSHWYQDRPRSPLDRSGPPVISDDADWHWAGEAGPVLDGGRIPQHSVPTWSVVRAGSRPARAAAATPPRLGFLRRGAIMVGLTVVAASAGAIAGIVATAGPDEVVTVDAEVTPTLPVSLTTEPLTVGAVVDLLENSVVSIETTVEADQGPFRTEGTGAGTGIVLRNGYILTNAHVVDQATSVEITIPSTGRAVPATIVGRDTVNDVAVLSVGDSTGLVPVEIASRSSDVGDDVVAIGNALALEGGLTVTSGIVSAVDRSIETAEGELDNLIQTDAAISSGNSGGALVNVFGEVIGMNTVVATGNSRRAASNIGFAIAVDAALDVASTIVGEEISTLS